MSIGTWLAKAVKNTGAFLAKAFTAIKDDADVVAISITEGIKAALADGVLGAISDIVDSVFHTTIGADVIALLNANISKILAVELAIQGLPDNPTEADIQAFENNVITTVTGLTPTGKSKLYTTLAAQIYGLIETQINNKEPLTFALLVADIESAYQDFLTDQSDSTDSNA